MKTNRLMPMLKRSAATASAIAWLLLLLAAPATVQAQHTPPGFTIQPSNPPPTAVGLSATFSVVASGSQPLSYQSYGPNGLFADAGDFSGVNSPTLTVDPVALGDAGTYSVTVNNQYGTANSSNAVLSVFADTNFTQYFSAGTNYVAKSDFALADLSFSNALNISPTNATYNFFYAVAELFSLPEEPTSSNFLSRLGYGSSGRDIFHWQAQAPTNSHGHLIIPSTTPPLNADEFTAQLRTNVLYAIINAQTIWPQNH